MSIGDKMRADLARTIARLEISVAKMRAEERLMVADVTQGGHMPHDYWHARWKAEERLKAAQRLLEALEE